MTLQPLIHEVDPREPEKGSRFVDLSGMTTEAFTVIKLVGFVRHYSVYLCRCRCDNEFIRRNNSIKQRPSDTCGKCRKLEHRYCNLHQIWMRHRDDMGDSFANNFGWFVEWSGGRRKKYLRKRDESRPHSENNSYWSAKRGGHILLDGKRTSLKELGTKMGLTRERVRQRIRDWGIYKALSTPAGLSREGTHMPVASTNLAADDSKRLKLLSLILDDSPAGILKRLVRAELEEHCEALDAMMATADAAGKKAIANAPDST